MGEACQASKQPTLSCSTCSCRFLSSPKFSRLSGETSWHRVADGNHWTKAAGVTMWIGIHCWDKIWNKYVITHMFFYSLFTQLFPPSSWCMKTLLGYLVVIHNMSHCTPFFFEWVLQLISITLGRFCFRIAVFTLCCFDGMRQHHHKTDKAILPYKCKLKFSQSDNCPLTLLQV